MSFFTVDIAKYFKCVFGLITLKEWGRNDLFTAKCALC